MRRFVAALVELVITSALWAAVMGLILKFVLCVKRQLVFPFSDN